jgi:F1F0 ATPase subunit 2
MLEHLTLMAASLTAGLVLGAFYFGGLWWTMRALPRAGHPALLVVFSYFGRMAVAMAALLLLALGGNWERLMACLAGFLLVKLAMIVRLGPGRLGFSGGFSGGTKMIREVEDGNQP